MQAQQDIDPQRDIIDVFIFDHVEFIAVAVQSFDYRPGVYATVPRIEHYRPALQGIAQLAEASNFALKSLP